MPTLIDCKIWLLFLRLIPCFLYYITSLCFILTQCTHNEIFHLILRLPFTKHSTMLLTSDSRCLFPSYTFITCIISYPWIDWSSIMMLLYLIFLHYPLKRYIFLREGLNLSFLISNGLWGKLKKLIIKLSHFLQVGVIDRT